MTAAPPLESSSLSAEPLFCPSCGARVSLFDQYCGVCGTVLVVLSWRTPEEDTDRWHSSDGHLAVRKGMLLARVLFRNQGVVPAGLVLRAEDIGQLPEWVDRRALGALPPVLLQAGEVGPFEIPLVEGPLAEVFDPGGVFDGEYEPHRSAPLPFLTNLNELRGGRWVSRPFLLTLLVTGQPRIVPACSHYRFLPVERLGAGRLEHEVEVRNETIHTIDLVDFKIEEDPSPTPAGFVRLPPETVVPRVEFEPIRIKAGDIWTDVLRIVPLEELPFLGWFSVRARYKVTSPDGGDFPDLVCRVQGRVGRGPTLRVLGRSELVVLTEQLQQDWAFSVENPGQLPLRIEAVEILREGKEGEEKVEGRDWLELSGIAAGDLLEPGEIRKLRVQLDPMRRPRDELDQEESLRRIGIRHDGLPSPEETRVDFSVAVRFGRAKELTAGIDFGTTNSVVCVRGTQAYSLRLEEDRDRIPSLMWFQSYDRSRDQARFLFGDEAFSAANIRLENLVRSIKTIVARNPRLEYVFYYRTSEEAGEQRLTRTTQELLNVFISELRGRAENGVVHLPPEAYKDLELPGQGTQVTLSRAVLTHPAEMVKEAQLALMEAAHRAGINESLVAVEDFFRESCIDEATAAVLAYVERQVQAPPIVDIPLSDCERVLCFDMGGGTTDIAAVEVLNIASFLAGEEMHVTVNLDAKTGVRFGGDDLDELLALLILEDIRRQSWERGSSVITDELVRAIQSRNYPDFKDGFLLRRRVEGPRENGATEREALILHGLATEILTKAEKAKRGLSSLDDSALPIISFDGNNWPRQKPTERKLVVENFDIEISRHDFEKRVKEEIRARLPLLDKVISGARWDWSSVTTLLFTGQSTRVGVIREEVTSYVEKQRGPETPALLCIGPDMAGFDPKNCVAIGAAIWGASQRELEPWLEINNRVREQLTFALQIKRGPRFDPVPGLNVGQPLPVEAELKARRGMDHLELYRDGGKVAYVSFRFPSVQQPSTIIVRIAGPSDFWVEVEGREYRGEVS